ncbi:MAG: hypothetical protein J0L81_02310 [Caulobacterales bacterium]|nr:hypothetical protein [Caulobacterales bacterium]
MGRPGGLQRYAGLDPAPSADASAPNARVRGEVLEACFGAARVEQQNMADEDGAGEGPPRSNGRRAGRPRGDPGDGTKSLARIEERMVKRADRTALRDALDLIRQQELLENIEARRARTRQRRWYVIGRALDELMEKDAALRAAVLAALDRHLTRRDERQLVGLAIHPNTK